MEIIFRDRRSLFYIGDAARLDWTGNGIGGSKSTCAFGNYIRGNVDTRTREARRNKNNCPLTTRLINLFFSTSNQVIFSFITVVTLGDNYILRENNFYMRDFPRVKRYPPAVKNLSRVRNIWIGCAKSCARDLRKCVRIMCICEFLNQILITGRDLINSCGDNSSLRYRIGKRLISISSARAKSLIHTQRASCI